MLHVLFFLLLFGFLSVTGHYLYFKETFYEKTITVKHKYTVNINGIEKNIIIDTDNEEYLIDSTIWYYQRKINPNFFEEDTKYHIKGYGVNFALLNLTRYIIDIN